MESTNNRHSWFILYEVPYCLLTFYNSALRCKNPIVYNHLWISYKLSNRNCKCILVHTLFIKNTKKLDTWKSSQKRCCKERRWFLLVKCQYTKHFRIYPYFHQSFSQVFYLSEGTVNIQIRARGTGEFYRGTGKSYGVKWSFRFCCTVTL